MMCKAYIPMNGSQLAELLNIWHVSRCALSGEKCDRYARMHWTSRWWDNYHPGEYNRAYKTLDRNTHV